MSKYDSLRVINLEEDGVLLMSPAGFLVPFLFVDDGLPATLA